MRLAAVPPAAPRRPPPRRGPGRPRTPASSTTFTAWRRARWILLNAFFVGLVAARSRSSPALVPRPRTFLPASEERLIFSLTAFLREVAIPGGGLL
jgi:hypothetical protein